MMRWKILPVIVFSYAIVVGAWIVAAEAIGDPAVLPGPWYIVTKSFPGFAIMGGYPPSYTNAMYVIIDHAWTSTVFCTIGAFIGTGTGAISGVALGFIMRERGDSLLGPAISATKNLPLFAFIPLFLFWFSAKTSTVIGYVAFATFILTLPAATAAAQLVSQKYIDLARNSGASQWGTFRTVMIPSAYPILLPTIRWMVSLMWAFGLGAEYAGSPTKGIGLLAYQAYLWADLGRMFVVALVYLAVGGFGILVFEMAESGLIGRPFFRNSR